MDLEGAELLDQAHALLLHVAGDDAGEGAAQVRRQRVRGLAAVQVERGHRGVVGLEGPLEFQGAFVRTIMQRRGIIIGTTEEEGFVRVDTEVPLAEMFGYSTDLRSSSQGKAEYTMEFSRYAPVPAEVHLELVKKYGTGLVSEDEE